MRTFPQVGTPFVPGAELGRRFYAEAVRPLLDAEFPGLPYAAAHLGQGSDVLGYDTAMSRDHDWGPTVTLFLPEAEAGRVSIDDYGLGVTLLKGLVTDLKVAAAPDGLGTEVCMSWPVGRRGY